jgi:hypothetical protein
MKKAEDLKEFVERMDNLKKLNPKDLSSDQDLSIGIMNLISIEEHLMFSGAKTGKTSFYDLINDIREMRKGLLQMMIKEYEGEVWCISKHLLSSSMRLMEVGTKQLSMNRKDIAYKLFGQSYDLYCLFWGLNTNLVDVKDVKWIADDTKDIEKISADLEKAKKDIAVAEKAEKKTVEEVEKIAETAPASGSVFGRLKGTIMKVVDCCIE